MNLTLNGLPIIVDQVAAEEIVRRHLLNGDTAVAAIATPGAKHMGLIYLGNYILDSHSEISGL